MLWRPPSLCDIRFNMISIDRVPDSILTCLATMKQEWIIIPADGSLQSVFAGLAAVSTSINSVSEMLICIELQYVFRGSSGPVDEYVRSNSN